MTQAMKTAALVELVSSLGADPHAVPPESMRIVLDNALKLARAHGYRPPDGKADGTAPRRQTTGERSAVAGDGPTVFPPFGRSKGQPIKGAALDTLRFLFVSPRPCAALDNLRFYEKCCVENLDNPDKAKWHHKEQKLLDAVRDELRRQGQAADHE